MKKPLFSSLRSTRPATSARRHALRRRPAIESLEGRQLLSGTTFYVNNSSDSAVQSLRWAIINSNNTPSTPSNPNVINFSELSNIAQIELQSPLPAITQPVIIDGTTESSYNGAHPFVQLIGNYAGGSAIGLDITAVGHAGQGPGHRRVQRRRRAHQQRLERHPRATTGSASTPTPTRPAPM